MIYQERARITQQALYENGENEDVYEALNDYALWQIVGEVHDFADQESHESAFEAGFEAHRKLCEALEHARDAEQPLLFRARADEDYATLWFFLGTEREVVKKLTAILNGERVSS